MDKIKFKRLLFDVACSAVACDRHIDDREIRELQYIDTSTTYFEDIDLSNNLKRFVENYKKEPTETIKSIIENLKTELLSPVEEMLVLEIVLRLVYADTKVDAREKKFIQNVRDCLSLDDDMITQRFGVIDFLVHSGEKISFSKEKSTKSIKSIDLTSIENMYADLGDKKKKN